MNQPVAQVKSQHLLLVDDEENVLNALVRVLRRDGYTLYTAKSVNQAFEILANNPIEVVLSDQRMPEKNGTVFLSEVKRSYPNTVRLMLSGYTEVGAVTEAINEGAIYKFLTKPWDDGQLRANIREAFHRFEIEAQNQRLHHEIEKVNADLLQLNHVLEQELHARNMRIRRDSSVACVMQEIIDHLPLGVLGID
ncbi:MAG: response regulator, partial [Limnobacter sp.]